MWIGAVLTKASRSARARCSLRCIRALAIAAAAWDAKAVELDPAEMREFHRVIAEQAAHMRGLIRDVLDAGRIALGTLSVASEPAEVTDLVKRARNPFQSGGGRHAVLVDLPAGLPPVLADRRRIVQVLDNLFSNAARHAPSRPRSASPPRAKTRTSPSRSRTRAAE